MAIPEGFWWGTAASSNQTEGSAPASTWRRWEDLGRVPRSGEGNGFATNYADDFGLLASYGLTHHRLSLEWARLEPREGRHDAGAVEHYTTMLRAARDAGVQVWVCLHHFTLPGWFGDDLGGFLDDRARSYHWARHVDWVGETFGDLVFGWQPVNEPVAYAGASYLLGMFPPGRRDPEAFFEALEAIHLADHEAWRLLRSGGTPVATIMNLSPVFPAVRSREPAERDRAEANTALFDAVYWTSWIRALRDGVLAVPGRPEREIPEMAGSFDLIGFSYYSAASVYADRSTGPYPTDARVGPMGYAPWPEGLGIVLRRLADELPGRPLLVAECGFGTPDDRWRTDLLRQSLVETERAIDDGVDVRGFFHWTGIDNYEWDHGYDVPFGLFDRDRRPKGSAALAAEWARR
ncbi:MAG: family 1 glycosylhydrolase [Acidimicrobiales bacterium]|jgi:beta-glucosidase|nr:family 1 glycosylhydrolase [Acidimicrobiales bacterium]